MVADALIYHPTVTHYLKFVALTAGRDKVLRTLQYFSRFYAWYLYRTNNPAATIAPFESMKKNFGMARKVLRFGKFVEHFKAAAVAMDAKGMDPVLRYAAIGRQLGYAGYLSLDNVAALDVVGIKKFQNVKQISRQATKFWMTGLLFNAFAGFYKLYQLNQQSQMVNKKEGEGAVEGKRMEKEWNATSLQLFSDLCDLVMPTTSLGFWDLDDGIVGLAGTTSSLLGVYSVWKKTA
ncbi:peroxisomal biogenesis factor 11 [Venturia nashicola]|uniref:Peroxisomal biogenesis factor 11 n=1 Tax=Venturia nashicola TaxID=86259 RepID=A0A4Z1NX26_9PEZI|nr:peroxisomal biogenesis factor 11 [Venturia nashicola]